MAKSDDDPSPPSPLPVDAGSSAADSRGNRSDWLPEASGVARGAEAAGAGSVKRASSKSGVARVTGDGIVDSPPPCSRAAASSISPNKKFHRDAMLSQSARGRLGVRVGRGRCEEAGGDLMMEEL